MIYLIAIHCSVKENLNPLLNIPTPQNDINEKIINSPSNASPSYLK